MIQTLDKIIELQIDAIKKQISKIENVFEKLNLGNFEK
jgi:hypothetical protein